MNRSAHQVISAGIYNLLLFMNIDACWEKTRVLCTYPMMGMGDIILDRISFGGVKELEEIYSD